MALSKPGVGTRHVYLREGVRSSTQGNMQCRKDRTYTRHPFLEEAAVGTPVLETACATSSITMLTNPKPVCPGPVLVKNRRVGAGLILGAVVRPSTIFDYGKVSCYFHRTRNANAGWLAL